MSDGTKILLGIGLGLAAGYYLQTEDGKKFRKKTAKQINKLDAQVRTTLKEQSETLTARMNELAENSKTWANNTAETVKSQINSAQSSAKDAVEEVESSFQQGVNKAKRKMQVRSEEISAIVENGQA